MKLDTLAKNSDTIKFDSEKYLEIAKKIGFYRINHLEAAFKKVEASINSNECVSTEFNVIKSELNNFVEAYYKVIASEYLYNGKRKDLHEDLQYIDYVHETRFIKSFGKKISKLSAEAKATDCWKKLQEFVEDLSPLQDTLEWLKAHFISASDKKKELSLLKEKTNEAYMKKYVSHESVKRVIDMLTTLTNEKRQEIFTNEYKFLKGVTRRVITAIESTADITPAWKRYDSVHSSFRNDPFACFVFSRICDRYCNVCTDVEDFCNKEAKYQADNLIDGFIYKNTSKIAFTIFTKNNMKDVTIDNIYLRQGKVECDLHISFNDGSKFTVTSSVVQAMSKLGKRFYRYPTTFHYVVMANGERMVSPSEQKMEEIFAVS